MHPIYPSQLSVQGTNVSCVALCRQEEQHKGRFNLSTVMKEELSGSDLLISSVYILIIVEGRVTVLP